MKIKFVLPILFFLFSLNCAAFDPGYTTARGSVFENYTMNKDVSSSTDIGAKTGSACVYNIFGAFTVGNGGVREASLKGDIKKVKAVDYSVSSFFSIYARLCTVARGD
ncbi:TRL domain-containing protein [Leptospira sp. 'Mane']|uniref:TRL domain-containing protein n=1 Tax=Leptospira sp. 'Mane' TaxID=3387407 RepID=UPI00398B3252